MTTLAVDPYTHPLSRRLALQSLAEQVGLDVTPEFERVVVPRPREKGILGGQQAGKSTAGAADIAIDVLLTHPDAEDRLYWMIVPNYRDQHTELQYLQQWMARLGLVEDWYCCHHTSSPSSPCRLILNLGGTCRIKVETITAENPEAISGVPCNGILGIEAGRYGPFVRVQAQGRIVTRRGWADWTGTLEDDEAHPRWLWYQTELARWKENPTPEAMAFSLPSWANTRIFPGGRTDPEILRWESSLDPFAFQRRVAGEPAGVQYAVYPMLAYGDWSFTPREDTRWDWSRGATGVDYGETLGHMSAVAAVTVLDRTDIAVVREVWQEQTSDEKQIITRRRLLSQKYRIPFYRSGWDPTLRLAAKMEGVMAVPASARQERQGLVYSRFEYRKLLFDLYPHDDSAQEQERARGVQLCLQQMQRQHKVKVAKKNQGEVLEYARIDDDGPSAVEDAIVYIDGKLQARPDRPLDPPRLGRGWGKQTVVSR